ncbi:hypothetical protein ACFLYL_04670 [Chloroflexota bacterium]
MESASLITRLILFIFIALKAILQTFTKLLSRFTYIPEFGFDFIVFEPVSEGLCRLNGTVSKVFCFLFQLGIVKYFTYGIAEGFNISPKLSPGLFLPESSCDITPPFYYRVPGYIWLF